MKKQKEFISMNELKNKAHIFHKHVPEILKNIDGNKCIYKLCKSIDAPYYSKYNVLRDMRDLGLITFVVPKTNNRQLLIYLTEKGIFIRDRIIEIEQMIEEVEGGRK